MLEKRREPNADARVAFHGGKHSVETSTDEGKLVRAAEEPTEDYRHPDVDNSLPLFFSLILLDGFVRD